MSTHRCMSSTLINERPLIVQPTLVQAFGFEHAVILQQIQFCLSMPKSGADIEGEHWIWNTAEQWSQDHFPFWKPDTIRKHLAVLEKMGCVVSAQFDKHNFNQRKYYRLNYERIDELVDTALSSETLRDSDDASSGTRMTDRKGRLELENSDKNAKNGPSETSMTETSRKDILQTPFAQPELLPFEASDSEVKPIIPAPNITTNGHKPRERDLLFDAVAEVTLSNPGIKSMGARIGKCTAELRGIGATPEQVHQVADWYSKYEWRGQAGNKLTFGILLEVWECGIKGIVPVKTNGNGSGKHVPEKGPTDIAIGRLMEKWANEQPGQSN